MIFSISNYSTAEALGGRQSPPATRLLLLLVQAELPPERALKNLYVRWDFDNEIFEEIKFIQANVNNLEHDMAIEAEQKLAGTMGGLFTALVILRWALEDDVPAVAEHYKAMLQRHQSIIGPGETDGNDTATKK